MGITSWVGSSGKSKSSYPEKAGYGCGLLQSILMAAGGGGVCTSLREGIWTREGQGKATPALTLAAVVRHLQPPNQGLG